MVSVFFSIHVRGYYLGLNHDFELHQLRYHMSLTTPNCMLNFRVISQRMLQLYLTAVNVKSWMVSHSLLLNECKTEAVDIPAAHNRKCVQLPVYLVAACRH